MIQLLVRLVARYPTRGHAAPECPRLATHIKSKINRSFTVHAAENGSCCTLIWVRQQNNGHDLEVIFADSGYPVRRTDVPAMCIHDAQTRRTARGSWTLFRLADRGA